MDTQDQSQVHSDQNAGVASPVPQAPLAQKNSKTPYIVLFIVIALIIVLAGGYVYFTMSVPQENIEQIAEPTPDVPSPTLEPVEPTAVATGSGTMTDEATKPAKTLQEANPEVYEDHTEIQESLDAINEINQSMGIADENNTL
jgi:flagellar basal body-associated protein FliL